MSCLCLVLDEIKWYSGSAVDFAFQQWFDAELKYEDQTDKYYISFGSKSILHVAKDTEGLYGSMSDELLESMVKICPERTEKLEFDENGCLTAASCATGSKVIPTASQPSLPSALFPTGSLISEPAKSVSPSTETKWGPIPGRIWRKCGNSHR